MHHLVRNALVFGGAWAIVPVVFFANASNGGQLVMTCLCAGMLAGGAIAFANIPVAAIAFTAPILVGTTICIGRSGRFCLFARRDLGHRVCMHPSTWSIIVLL
jgi:hypothetical protein